MDATMAARPQRTTGYSWFVLAVLCFVYILNFLDRQLLSILAKPIQDELHVTDGQLGLIGGAEQQRRYGRCCSVDGLQRSGRGAIDGADIARRDVLAIAVGRADLHPGDIVDGGALALAGSRIRRLVPIATVPGSGPVSGNSPRQKPGPDASLAPVLRSEREDGELRILTDAAHHQFVHTVGALACAGLAASRWLMRDFAGALPEAERAVLHGWRELAWTNEPTA